MLALVYSAFADGVRIKKTAGGAQTLHRGVRPLSSTNTWAILRLSESRLFFSQFIV